MGNQGDKPKPECGESCPAEGTVAAGRGRWKTFMRSRASLPPSRVSGVDVVDRHTRTSDLAI